MAKISLSVFSNNWRRFSLKARLSLLVGITAVGGAGVMARFALVSIQDERLQSVATATRERAFSLAMNARVVLVEYAGKREEFVITKETLEAYKDFKLPRRPVKGEYYVGERDGEPVLCGRTPSGGVWLASFSGVAVPWRSVDKLSYWFTAQGMFLGGSAKLVQKDGFEKRLLVQFYEQSSAQFGGDFFNPIGGKIFAAFYEVPKTNIVVAVESLTQANMESSKRVVLIALGISGVLLLTSLWIGAAAARSFVRPLGLILATLQRYSTGVFDYLPKYNHKDEIGDIFAVVREMGNVFQSREQNFHAMSTGLERLLVGSREMTVVHDRYTVSAIAVSVAHANLSLSHESNAWVYLLANPNAEVQRDGENQPLLFLTAQLMARGHSQPGTLVQGECVHAANPAQAILEKSPVLEATSQLLFMPIVHSERVLGFFVFEGYTGNEILQFEKTFMESLGSSVGIAIKNIQVLEETRDAALLEGELCAIQTVQESLISKNFEVARALVYSHFSPAQTAGGDWFHFNHCMHDNNLYLFIGDVTGHGIPSAIMTAVAFGAIRSAEHMVLSSRNAGVDAGQKLKLIAELVNSTIFEAGQEKFYMSMLFAALNLATGKLHIVSAGHPAPLWIQSQAEKAVAIGVGGTPLGSEQKGVFESTTRELSPGDGIFMFTDGLIENEGPDKKRFAKRDIAKILGRAREPEMALPELMERGNEIWKGHPQNDDLTTVLCWWKPE